MARWDVPGSCQVPPWAPPGRDVLCMGRHGPAYGDSVHHSRHSVPGWIWASSACVPWDGGGETPSITQHGARAWGAGRAASITALLGVSGAHGKTQHSSETAP